jgi:hypothetical protein
MTVLLTLTTAGIDTGPFDLYSNLDVYVTPFETGVSKAALQAGYTSVLVPDFTSIVRVLSKSNCTSFTDIILINTTTTTTTVPEVPCNATVTSGGVGVTESLVNLSPLGGLITFVLGARTVPDKLEILHSSVKKATSGMTVPNEGPFDNIYGDPTVPADGAAVSGIDQFVGLAKGTIPDRQATYFSETGSSLPIPPPPPSGVPFQQYVWWQYTSIDYLISSVATIRITGPTGTQWDLQRLCETTTTTTTPPP